MVFLIFFLLIVNHSRRYKIWEQSYANDKLNGEWRTYNLRGTVIRTQQYQNDSLNGLSRDYWIDGKTIMEEREFFKGSSKYIVRTFYKSGKPEAEQSYENGFVNGFSKKYYENGKLSENITIKGGTPDGPAKRYYEDGTIKEEVTFAHGQFSNVRKYYYPNGKLWIEQEYNDGLPWTVISNYDETGNKRNAGTLKNGNGTLILYNEDGTVRETLTYENGKEK